MAAGLGPAGQHASQDSFQTPPTVVPNNFILSPDPGYVQQARSLQAGPQGSSSPGINQPWKDSFHRTP